MVYSDILARELFPLSVPILNLDWHPFIQRNWEFVCLFLCWTYLKVCLIYNSDIITNDKRYKYKFIFQSGNRYLYLEISLDIFICIYPFDPINDDLTNWICYANYLLLASSDMKVPKIESNIHIAGESIKLL